jgi:hypothetical protein
MDGDHLGRWNKRKCIQMLNNLVDVFARTIYCLIVEVLMVWRNKRTQDRLEGGSAKEFIPIQKINRTNSTGFDLGQDFWQGLVTEFRHYAASR